MSDAIQAGIFNDLGSGSNVDVTVLTKDGAEVLRNHLMPNERPPKEQSYVFKRGTTAVLSTSIRKFVDVVEVTHAVDAMDLS